MRSAPCERMQLTMADFLVRRLRDVKSKAMAASPSSVAAKPAADQANGIEDPSAMALEEFCHTLISSAAMLYID